MSQNSWLWKKFPEERNNFFLPGKFWSRHLVFDMFKAHWVIFDVLVIIGPLNNAKWQQIISCKFYLAMSCYCVLFLKNLFVENVFNSWLYCAQGIFLMVAPEHLSLCAAYQQAILDKCIPTHYLFSFAGRSDQNARISEFCLKVQTRIIYHYSGKWSFDWLFTKILILLTWHCLM